MPKADAQFPVPSATQARARKAPSWKYWAILLSLAAHCALVLLVVNRLVLPSPKKSAKPSAERVMTIRLAPAQNGVTRPETVPAAVSYRAAKPASPAKTTTESKPPTESEPSQVNDQSDTPAYPFEILLPPPPNYFSSKALTEKPRVLVGLPVDLGTSITGQLPGPAYFRLLINERGEVDRVIVEETTFSEEEQGIVLAAFQKMKFSPGKIDDRPVKTELKFEVIVVERKNQAVTP